MRRAMLFVVLIVAVAMIMPAAGSQQQAATAPRRISVYDGLWENIATLVNDLNGTPLYQEVARRTGIEVEWVHPPAGGDQEFFNLMIAADDLPDAIYRSWTGYPGGPQKALDDGVLIPLNDVIARSAPNFNALMAANPDWDRGARTDAGTQYMFPFIRGHGSLLVFFGPALRADWLEELNLEVPETIDEWETVLTALRQKTGGQGPLTMTSFQSGGRQVKTGPAWVSAFGIRMDFYRDNGVVKFGQYEPAYRDFLEVFRRWYANGLIDPEFITNDLATFNAKVLNDRAGAFLGYTGSNIGVFLDAKRDDPVFDIVAAPYPVLQRGQTPFSGQRDFPLPGNGLGITSAARNPELVAEWADFAFGAEGHMLYNFGIEGESYNMIDGFPQYSDIIMNNPEWGVAPGLGMYTRAVYSGPIVQDERYIVQYLGRDQQRDALEKWFRTDAENNIMPPVTPTPQESQRLSAIMTEVNTYADEMFVRFIVGDEPLSNFPQYRAQLQRMGIEEAIAIRQAALDRFNAR
jgi:putative aldouronate transport system substrate-binding protein